MLNYLDILDRAQTGPYISEENWDLEKIAMTTGRLVKKYKLEWNPNELVTDDAALSEAIWKAGYEMAVELGSYSRSTERILQLSQDEIDSGVRNMPQEGVMGEGKDARRLDGAKLGGVPRGIVSLGHTRTKHILCRSCRQHWLPGSGTNSDTAESQRPSSRGRLAQRQRMAGIYPL